MSEPHVDSQEYKPLARIRRLERTLLRIAEEPGSGPEKAAIAWAALKPKEARP